MNSPLPALREALLDLHKTLIDSERVVYEETFGPIQSPGEFLQLLTGDPWFAWLHAISEIIVAIDEKEGGKSRMGDITEAELVNQARRLLVAVDKGEGFSKHYFDALQRDPDVVLAHARVMESFSSAR